MKSIKIFWGSCRRLHLPIYYKIRDSIGMGSAGLPKSINLLRLALEPTIFEEMQKKLNIFILKDIKIT